LRWHRKQTGHRASQTCKISFAFDHRRRKRDLNLFGFRFLGFGKSFVSRIVQRLDAEPHRLNQYGSAA
jgi:hypothetical protein